MRRFTDKFSVTFLGIMFGLSAFSFWASSTQLHFFFLRVFQTMTEPWFLPFAFFGGFLLYYLNVFAVFILMSSVYLVFMAWPNVQPDQLLYGLSNHLGEVTVLSVLLSPDAFRIYAMLIAITFCDVLGIASENTNEEATND